MSGVKFKPSGEVSVRQFHFGQGKSSRTSIIKHLISKYQLESYLEIGVRDFYNFDQIDCVDKTAVDPRPIGGKERAGTINLYAQTSDQFFESLNPEKRFDLIFIDGLHLAEQVEKDIDNALAHLSDAGFIVMHDCNPPTEFHQREVYKVDGKFPPWNGTTWKAFAKKRMQDKGLEMAVVNTDWGVGLIRRGAQKLFPMSEILDWNLLDDNRTQLLNLISVEQFLDLY